MESKVITAVGNNLDAQMHKYYGDNEVESYIASLPELKNYSKQFNRKFAGSDVEVHSSPTIIREHTAMVKNRATRILQNFCIR